MTRVLLIAIGGILALVGLVWIGQGSGIVPGSVMTGDPKWLLIGVGCLLVGAALVVVGIRRRGRTPAA